MDPQVSPLSRSSLPEVKVTWDESELPPDLVIPPELLFEHDPSGCASCVHAPACPSAEQEAYTARFGDEGW